MKTEPKMILTTVGLALALAMTSAPAQGAMSGGAKVIRLQGAARSSTGNFVWQPIKVGDVLSPGTLVQTSADPGAYIDLVLGDKSAATLPPPPTVYRPTIPNSLTSMTPFQPTSEQNTVRLWADGILGIDTLNFLQTGAGLVIETQLDLKRGRITANVKKLSAASKYEVKFPNGVAGVRGTVFDLQAAGMIKLYVGSMVVASVDPATQKVTTQTLSAGQSYDVASNLISPLSAESMGELEELPLELVGTQAVPIPTILASDRTAIGMSPVGANPASLPLPIPGPGNQRNVPPPGDGGVVTTSSSYPPPITGR